MKRLPVWPLVIALVLAASGSARSDEYPPTGTGLPAAGENNIKAYVVASHKTLIDLDEAMRVKSGDPRSLKKTHWWDLCAKADKSRSLGVASASMSCKKAGLDGLPSAILNWHNRDLLRWHAVRDTGAKLFSHRNLMAQFAHDLEQVDGPAWGSKLTAIWDAGKEIDAEHRRLEGLMGSLASVSKSQLEKDRLIAAQMIRVTQALADKCRDLKKDYKEWFDKQLKPDAVKSLYTKTLKSFVYDKKVLPTFYAHKGTWKKHLDAWHKQYAMYYRDFGKSIEKFDKEKGVFKGHGRCLEDLTFDQIDDDITDDFRNFYSKLNLEVAGR